MRGLRRLMMAGAALLLTIPSARADFEIDIFSGATLLFQSIDNVAEDDNGVPNQIGLSAGALADLNQALSGAGLSLTFNNLSATTNQGSADPFANLTVNGQVQGTGSITVDVSSSDYNTPAGMMKVVDSSASETFTNAQGSTGRFTSYFNPNNNQSGRVTATGFLSFAAIPGLIVSSPPGVPTGPIPLIVSGPNPFALENVTTLNLVGNATSKIGFSGTTTVSSLVPEPTSIALLLLGGSFMAIRMRRTTKVA
jgi:hypothetical protein